MDNEFSPFDKAQEIVGNVLKMRLVGQKLHTEAMDFNRPCVNLSFGVEIDMKMISAELPIKQFDAADFDDPVTLSRVKSSRFGIKNDLTNHRCACCF